MWPFSDNEAEKTGGGAQAPTVQANEVALSITTVQQGLAAHFGASQMAHSCGSGTCDGRWGPGTERVLDRAFNYLEIPVTAADASYEVKGSFVVLPASVARWLQAQARTYTPARTSGGGGSTEFDVTQVPAPYSSIRRRMSSGTKWLIAGGVTAAAGLGALGYTAWKRGRR